MTFQDFVACCANMPVIRSQVFPLITDNPRLLRRQVSEWLQKGWLHELKRGVYVVADSVRRSPASNVFIANYLVTPSYISLETALSYYRLIPERVVAVTSITSKKTQRFDNPIGHFIYHHIKQSCYQLFVPQQDEFQREYYIATPEKAVVDYFYFYTSTLKTITSDYFAESMRLQNTERLSTEKLRFAAALFDQKKLAETIETLIHFMEEET